MSSNYLIVDIYLLHGHVNMMKLMVLKTWSPTLCSQNPLLKIIIVVGEVLKCWKSLTLHLDIDSIFYRSNILFLTKRNYML